MFGDLICCDTCPTSFHAGCIGYRSLDFLREDQSWSCWECCTKRPNLSFTYDTTPIVPKTGSTLYISTNSSFTSYVPGKVIGMDGATIKLLLDRQGNQINYSIHNRDKRIWRGPFKAMSGRIAVKTLLERSNGKYFPAFHKVKAINILTDDLLSRYLAKKPRHVLPALQHPNGKKAKEIHKASEANDAPLSDVSAAAVLGSLHLSQQTTKYISSNVRSNRLKMTNSAKNLKEGDRVEAWLDATEYVPGGWAPGVLSKVIVTGDGSLFPYFAFYLISYDHLDVSHHGEVYKEWRPLAKGNLHELFIQVRREQKNRPSTFSLQVVRVGDKIESKIQGISCPGIVRKIDNNGACTIEFKSPILNTRHKLPHPHSRTLQKPTELLYEGMLSVT